jgi:hypothetical protein
MHQFKASGKYLKLKERLQKYLHLPSSKEASGAPT